MKKIIYIAFVSAGAFMSCQKPYLPVQNDPPAPAEGECVQCRCSSVMLMDCSFSYEDSLHNNLTWQEYRDSILNDPPDTCDCSLTAPSVEE